MTVTLRPMTQAEFDARVEASFTGFVAEMVRTGELAEADAPAEVRRRRQQNLPKGLGTAGMLFLVGDVDDEPIGWIWIALPGRPPHPLTAWVYNVEVDEAHRGRGYGRELMLAAEDELVRHGVTKLGLNVFAGNTTAIQLYERLGYEVISQQMIKSLRP